MESKLNSAYEVSTFILRMIEDNSDIERVEVILKGMDVLLPHLKLMEVFKAIKGEIKWPELEAAFE